MEKLITQSIRDARDATVTKIAAPVEGQVVPSVAVAPQSEEEAKRAWLASLPPSARPTAGGAWDANVEVTRKSAAPPPSKVARNQERLVPSATAALALRALRD